MTEPGQSVVISPVLLILIPTVAAAGEPDGAAHAAVDFVDESLLGVCADFDDAVLAALHELQTLHGVADLGFDHQDDGIVAEAGVGPEKHKEIREAGDGDAEIGAHALSPGVVNFHAAAADDAATDERFGGAEAGAINQDVDGALHAVFGDDAVLAHFGDAIGDQLDVRTVERRVVIVGNQHALAAQLIVGRQRGADFGIFDLALAMAMGDFLGLLADGFVAEKTEYAKFLAPENELAQGPARERDAAKAAFPLFA